MSDEDPKPIGDIVGDLMETVWSEKFRKQRVADKSRLADELALWSETVKLRPIDPVMFASLAVLSQKAYEARMKIPVEEEVLRRSIEEYIEALDLVTCVPQVSRRGGQGQGLVA